jgi:hypothetical protein
VICVEVRVRKSFCFYVYGGVGNGDEREIENESVFFCMKVNVTSFDPFPNPKTLPRSTLDFLVFDLPLYISIEMRYFLVPGVLSSNILLRRFLNQSTR